MKPLRFFTALLRSTTTRRTVIVLEDDSGVGPAYFSLSVRSMRVFVVSVLLLTIATVLTLAATTPLFGFIPGFDRESMVSESRLNAIRLAAVEDSLEIQQAYVEKLQRLMLGPLDSLGEVARGRAIQRERMVNLETTAGIGVEDGAPPPQPPPALTMAELSLTVGTMPMVDGQTDRRPLNMGITFPAPPPVEGYFTQGFDVRAGHFGIDIAAQEGSVVRALGEGYVIFSDWTHEGGNTLVIQHGLGYTSVYKHNAQLIKRVGDRVRRLDPVALSGNTGMETSGPHLHFEIWHDGLAQDPRYFIQGL